MKPPPKPRAVHAALAICDVVRCACGGRSDNLTTLRTEVTCRTCMALLERATCYRDGVPTPAQAAQARRWDEEDRRREADEATRAAQDEQDLARGRALRTREQLELRLEHPPISKATGSSKLLRLVPGSRS